MDSQFLESWLEETIGFENPKLGLSRINKALDTFSTTSISVSPPKIITIGGTNGKGGCARLLHQTLSKKYRSALFTSPHLKCITERFIGPSGSIQIDELSNLFILWKKNLDDHKLSLSYFEFLFFIFVKWIEEQSVEFLVLEVGLGGRLDSTNSFNADISVITSIGRDHQGYLGSTYKKILTEKLGISRVDKPLITAFTSDYLMELMKSHQLDSNFIWSNIDVGSFHFEEVTALLVERIVKELGISISVDRKTVVFEGNFLFYGSHNLAAVRKLVQYLNDYYYNELKGCFDMVLLSFSERDEKEIQAMIKIYKSLKTKIILTSFEHFKSASKEKIEELAKKNGLEFVHFEDIKLSSFENKKVLVSGSNYFIGCFKRFIC